MAKRPTIGRSAHLQAASQWVEWAHRQAVVPVRQRLTARVMLDDHVRVDDAHRRKRIDDRSPIGDRAVGFRSAPVEGRPPGSTG
jgi:hypothetical protein